MKTVKSLKSATKTEIFTFVAKKFGNDNIKQKVYDFLKNHSVYGNKIAYRMAYVSDKVFVSGFLYTPIANVVSFAKQQKKETKSNYSKVLIEGNTNIYWASENYGHADYNKSIAMPLNEANAKIMNLVNSYLSK